LVLAREVVAPEAIAGDAHHVRGGRAAAATRALDLLLIVGLVRQELEHGTACASPTDAGAELDDLGLGPIRSSRPPAQCGKAAGQLEPAPLAQERLNSRPRPARPLARQSGRRRGAVRRATATNSPPSLGSSASTTRARRRGGRYRAPRHACRCRKRPRKVPSLVRTRRAPPRIAGRVAPLACAVRALRCRPLRHPRRPRGAA
jgi:hypothetical protein